MRVSGRMPKKFDPAFWSLHASIIALAHIWSPSALSQTTTGATSTPEDGASVRLKTLPPKGFEDIGDSVSTDFDLVFQERTVGAFRAVFRNGQLSFAAPAAVARDRKRVG